MEDTIKELEAKKDVKGLEEVRDEANASYEGGVAGLAEQAIARLTSKVESVETTTPAQVSQVESMGGSADEVAKRTEGVDEEIETVKTDATTKIAEVCGVASVPEVSVSPEAQVAEVKDSSEVAARKKEIERIQAFLKKKQEKKDENLGKVYTSQGLITIEEAVKNKEANGDIDLFQYTANILNANAIIESGLVSPKEVMNQITNMIQSKYIHDVGKFLLSFSPETIKKLENERGFSEVLVLCEKDSRSYLSALEIDTQANGLLAMREFRLRYGDILARNGVKSEMNEMIKARDEIVRKCNESGWASVSLLVGFGSTVDMERAFDSIKNHFFKREDLLRWCKEAIESYGGGGDPSNMIIQVLSLKEKNIITEAEANEILGV